MLFRNPEPDVGCPGDERRVRMFGVDFRQFVRHSRNEQLLIAVFEVQHLSIVKAK